MLQAKKACQPGIDLFIATYGESAEYQDILDFIADSHTEYANWLLNEFGSDGATKIITEQPTTNNVFAAGNLEIKIDLVVKGHIKAGGRIEAEEGIKAGWGIRAGKGIEAGWGIEAGEVIEVGRGIKAGEGIEAEGGIKAGGGIKAKLTISVRLRILVGLINWRLPIASEQTVTCSKLVSGTVALGTLVETGQVEEVDK